MKRQSILVLAVVLAIGGTAFGDLNDGLIAYYPFNGNANDESGNGNNGTVYGAILSMDRFGNPNSAYSFDGVDDLIAIPNAFSQQITTNQLSLSAWILFDEDIGNTQTRILCKQQLNGRSWGLEIFGAGYGGSSGNQINFHDSDGSTWYNGLSSTHLNPFQLYHVVVTDNSGHIKIYINAKEDYSTSGGFGIPSSIVSQMNIGVTNPPNRFFFDGKLDDIRVYNRVLSASEVEQLYVVPLPAAVLLGVLGLGTAGWRLRRRTL